MCGLTGFFRPAGGLEASAREDLQRMTGCLSHRGPDSEGMWVDESPGIALGHRRLAILELSDAGSQPMTSAAGRYVAVVNGEIYNHPEIREALERDGASPIWRGHSDIETLLAAIDRWGAEAALEKSVGMFALALWDRQARSLLLARDRMGEKPVYYGWQGGLLLFGSELKALRAHPAFHAGIDRTQLALYMQRGYVPTPGSIHDGIFKLPPGCWLRFRAGLKPGELPEPQQYWSVEDAARRRLADPFEGSDREAVEQLDAALSRAVLSQSQADVPLGAFLSGGIDSSTVVALMQAQSSRPVLTFAIGFEEADFNEAPHARAVARHLGTEHAELVVTAKEAMDVVPRLPRIHDEPFGDSSAIPTFLVAQLARRQVTVSLSGDGGDELFGGYTRYPRGLRLWRALRVVPQPLRAALAPAFGGHYARFVAAASAPALYDTVMLDPAAAGLVLGSPSQAHTGALGMDQELARDSFYHAMMLVDCVSYLPDDILVKVDRASMAVSLESRVPLLDHRVVELAWRMPLRMKLRGGQTKWLLRQLLRQHVPESLHDRPKKGFGVPVGEWVRGPMRDWAESLLDATSLRQEGFLDWQRVRELWSRHLAGAPRLAQGIWRVLMFQAWVRQSGRA